MNLALCFLKSYLKIFFMNLKRIYHIFLYNYIVFLNGNNKEIC